MKTISHITKKKVLNSGLDTPPSVHDVKIMLLNKEDDFYNSAVKQLFRVPKNNYPNFENWYSDKLIKDAIQTANDFNISNALSDDSFHDNESDSFKKLESQLINGRLVLVASVNDNLAGISVLKKDTNEKKISTFFIEEKYGSMGLAKLLLEASFIILGSEQVDITVSENNIEKLYPFLIKNGFKEYKSINGQYKKNIKEIYFKRNKE